MEINKASRKCTMLLFLASLSYLMFSAAMPCPHQEDVYPCICIKRFPHSLFCGGPNITMSQVKKAFDEMVKIVGVFDLKLKNVNVGKVDANLFNGNYINRLYFDDCNIEGFVGTGSKQGDNPPRSLFVKILEIHNSIHRDIEINLAAIGNLNHFSLSNNVVKNLKIDWGIGSVMFLYLFNNSIESVDEDAFTPLTALENLDMSMNRLERIGREMRPADAKSLSTIDFTHNRIVSISNYYFYNMPSLKYVSLSNNRIQVLSEKTWKLTWSQLSYVNLQENPLSCGPEIKWIQGLQPQTVRGTCSTPADKKSKTLAEVIKGNIPTQH